MDAIQYIINSPHKGETFVIVIAAILSVQFFVKIFDWCVERFGIQTKGMRREKMQTEQIEQLKSEIDEVKEEVNEIKDYSKDAKIKRIEFEEQTTEALKEIREDLIDVKINALRNKILEFSANCRLKKYDKESFDNCLMDYDEYCALIKKHGRVNSRIDMAMINVRKVYEEYLDKGFPTYQ